MADPNFDKQHNENRESENDTRGNAGQNRDGAQNPSGPEPPPNYNAQSPRPQIQLPGAQNPYETLEFLEFQSARRMISVAQIMSLISLVIGGVALSTAALVVAILGFRKVTSSLHAANGDMVQTWLYLRRSSTIAIIMSCIALTANAVTLIIVYPTLMESLQSGDFASYFGLQGSSQGGASSSGSFWG